MTWLDHILTGPADPDRLARDFPWAAAMIGCPHDPVYHSEGDPWTHTAMVAAELEAGDGFAGLPEERREILRLAAWFHDVAKPMTTEIVWDEELKRERVRQPGHAPLGAKIAWQALVDAGYDPLRAREIHSLVFWHQRPTHMMDQNNTLSRVIRFGQEVNIACWDDLLRLCAADQAGRISLANDGADLNLEILRMWIEEEARNAGMDLLGEPWRFPSAAARHSFLRGSNTMSPFVAPKDPAGSRMILMSGLPGAGKDTAIARHFPGLPVVSLDDIRADLDIAPTGNQGRVLQAAFEQARVHLRAKQDFVWNATCLSRFARQKITGLARDYDARIEAVSLDVPLTLAKSRNAQRSEPVPDRVIEKLGTKREAIMPDEVHALWTAGPDLNLRPVFGEPVIEAEPCPIPS
ncbi:AAA family ATPase [Defluviimonas salinarum]|uniref:AAA family ATPase n=1 Tax=Defluviimonas salinarum TaxID=2992147 RepID=A0ABT3J6E7_9RHOB|nr:AAA family ATPase [Defluviimonas salinarum]MCW3783025.1 AAA family ATPase [Defluviimonas salinarum]